MEMTARRVVVPIHSSVSGDCILLRPVRWDKISSHWNDLCTPEVEKKGIFLRVLQVSECFSLSASEWQGKRDAIYG